ncbi:MAG: hydroxymethylglutaryl-CoA lyase [Halioglobus sp.]
MRESVIITDVGPRDGLQNQARLLQVEERVLLVEALTVAGLPRIEAGAFVSPKAVPAMAGSDAVIAGLDPANRQRYSALIPNRRGYELARDAGLCTMAMVVYASDAMAQENVGMSAGEAMQATVEILRLARADNVEVLATIAVAFECPFTGRTAPQTVCDIARQCLDMGAAEVVVADTIGAAAPSDVSDLMGRLVSELSAEKIGCHFHDTRAMGLANVYAALEAGIRRFDASIGGMGGCPFAPGASGNVATEDVVMMVEQMGYSTGVDQSLLLHASDLAQQLTGAAPGGRAKNWLKPRLQSESG